MTIFVNKGDLPLTPAQLENRAQKHINRSWPDQAREKSIRTADGGFDAFMATFSANHDTNIANNTFNWQLQEYTKATARLARYVLAAGKPEQTFEEPTGQYDDLGDEIMNTWVQAGIDPLDAQVEQAAYDDEGNVTGTVMVHNPLIVTDTEERAAAQAVIDATPDEVKNFIG